MASPPLRVFKRLLPYVLAGAIAVVTLNCFFSGVGLLAASESLHSYSSRLKLPLELLLSQIGAGFVAWTLLSLQTRSGIRVPMLFYSFFFLAIFMGTYFYFGSSSYLELGLPTDIKLMVWQMSYVLPILLVPILLILWRNKRMKSG